MTDQTQMLPADKVRDLRDQYACLIEDAGTKEAQAYYGHVVKDLTDLLPRPTLADMTPEERDTCRRMQADVKDRDRRPVIVNHCWDDETARVMWPHGFIEEIECERVTPRPDLPRLEWPGDKKPALASALPDGWRLADHPNHGRVIVTNTIPNRAGDVCYVLPTIEDSMGYDWFFCTPDELTYLDQEPDQ